MRLENYIMEQDINTASVADIFVEQAQAELNVAMSLLDATVKDLTFQEFAVYQEGELGDSVSAARAEVRSDGKKHHIKAAFAAIKAFFKFLITKVGSFFKKSTVEADAFTSKMSIAMKEASAVAGTEMDIKLPYTKEQFGKIYSYYDSLDKKLEKISDISNQLLQWFYHDQNTFTDNTTLKFKKELEAFIAEAKKAESIAVKDSKFSEEVAKKKEEIKKILADRETFGPGRSIKGDQKVLKAAYADATRTLSDADWMLDTDGNWVFAPKNSDSIYIGFAEYQKFDECLKRASKYWAEEKKKLESNLKEIDSMRISSTDEYGNRSVGLSEASGPAKQNMKRPEYDKNKSKNENKQAVDAWKKERDKYNSGRRDINKNRVLADMSNILSKLQTAVTGVITAAEKLISDTKKTNLEKAVKNNRAKYSGNVGPGRRFPTWQAAAEFRKAHPDVSLKDDDDDISGMPKARSKYNDPSRSAFNADSSKETTTIGGIEFMK